MIKSNIITWNDLCLAWHCNNHSQDVTVQKSNTENSVLTLLLIHVHRRCNFQRFKAISSLKCQKKTNQTNKNLQKKTHVSKTAFPCVQQVLEHELTGSALKASAPFPLSPTALLNYWRCMELGSRWLARRKVGGENSVVSLYVMYLGH